MAAFNNRYRETTVLGIPVFGIFLIVIALFILIAAGALATQGAHLQACLLLIIACTAITYTSWYLWLGERRPFAPLLITSYWLEKSKMGDELL